MKRKKLCWDNKKGLYSYNLRPYKKRYKNRKIKVFRYSFCYKITIGGIISDEHNDTQTSKKTLIYKLLYQTPSKNSCLCV